MIVLLRNIFVTWILKRLGVGRLMGCGCLFILIGLVMLIYALNQLF